MVCTAYHEFRHPLPCPKGGCPGCQYNALPLTIEEARPDDALTPKEILLTTTTVLALAAAWLWVML